MTLNNKQLIFWIEENGREVSHFTPEYIHYFSLLVAQILYVLIIHAWVYGAVKFKKGYGELKSSVNDFIADNKISDEQWKHNDDLIYFTNFKNLSFKDCFLKLFYFAAWIAIIVCIVLGLYFIGILRCDYDSGIMLVLIIMASMLFFSSYYLCMDFPYIIRNIANVDIRKVKYNHFRPSQTKEIQLLVHCADAVSIAFFVESSMVSLAYLAAIWFNQRAIELHEIQLRAAYGCHAAVNATTHENVWMIGLTSFLVFLPSIISFVPVYALPRIFLNRLIWRLKFHSLSKYISIDVVYAGRNSHAYSETDKHEEGLSSYEERDKLSGMSMIEKVNCVDMLSNDRLQVGMLNTMIAVAVTVLNIVATIISIG